VVAWRRLDEIPRTSGRGCTAALGTLLPISAVVLRATLPWLGG
jgi:hypothetical protein